MSCSYSFKYAIIGDSGVGKHEILLQLEDKIFDVPFGTRTISIDGKKIRLEIWEMPGQHHMGLYVRRAAGVLLVYDVTRHETFEHLTRWLKDTREHASPNVVIMLIGARADLEEKREVRSEEGLSFAKENGLIFVETSSKTMTNIEEAFINTTREIYQKIQDGVLDVTDKANGIEVDPSHSGGVNPTKPAPEGGFLKRVSGWFGSQKTEPVKPEVPTPSITKDGKVKPPTQQLQPAQQPAQQEGTVTRQSEVKPGQGSEVLTEWQVLFSQDDVATLEEQLAKAKEEVVQAEVSQSIMQDELLQARAEICAQKCQLEELLGEQRVGGRQDGLLQELQQQVEEQLQEQREERRQEESTMKAENTRLLQAKTEILSQKQQLEEQIQNMEHQQSKEMRSREHQFHLLTHQIHSLENQLHQQRQREHELQQQVDQQVTSNQELHQRLQTALAEIQHLRSVTLTTPPQGIDIWKIPSQEVEIMEDRVLGRGAWGYVAEGIFRGKRVAVKCMHQEILNPHTIERVYREIRTMAQVRHPNLLLFIAAALDCDTTPMIVTEILDMNLRAAYEREVLGSSRLAIFQDIASALNYLHLHHEPIIHRDVSAPNILLEALANNNWKAKLSDFGSANLAQLSKTLGEGALIYTAPEMFPHAHMDLDVIPPPQTTKIDVYSFGILLCEVITSQLPDPAHYRSMLQQVQSQWPLMHRLIVVCTKHDPNDRPTMASLLTELDMTHALNLHAS